MATLFFCVDEGGIQLLLPPMTAGIKRRLQAVKKSLIDSARQTTRLVYTDVFGGKNKGDSRRHRHRHRHVHLRRTIAQNSAGVVDKVLILDDLFE
jgi:hypothetical protein